MLLQVTMILMIHAIKGEQDIIELEFPSPTFASINNLPDIVKDAINGCLLAISRKGTVILSGPSCKGFPSDEFIQTFQLKLRTSKISVLKKNDFWLFRQLTTLDIEFNLELVKIEPGCFQNMSKLENMSISFNKNLKHLDDNVFEGLINLRELHMNKNGFTKVYDITRVLSVRYVPSLLKLSMDENLFRNILKNDFTAMNDTKLEELQIILCQIEYIHPESFNPLKNLQNLKLGQNQFNVTTIENLIKEVIKQNIPLKSLDLYDNGFRKKPPMTLLKLIAQTNISSLYLGGNTFDNLNENSFPNMSNLVFLDLSYCLLLAIEPKTFQKLPNLETLILVGNKLPCLGAGLSIKNLKLLDVSGNSGNPISRSYFRVDYELFKNVDQLYGLQMSNNLLTQISSLTFQALHNLRYLGLKNTTIFNIEDGAFRNLKQLTYLNLENNQLTFPLKANTFVGLDMLKTLLLSGCSIQDLRTVPSPFEYLHNLEYLGLGGNEIYILAPAMFQPLIYMKSLDLSQNKLTEWPELMFGNLSVSALDLSENKFKFLTNVMLEDFKYLDILNLEGNPFICDCSLYPAAQWLRHTQYALKYMTFEDIDARCVNDEFSLYSIFTYMKFLGLNQDECATDTTFHQTILISVLAVISTLVAALSILGYMYRLHVRHWILLARMALRRLRNIKYKKDYTYLYDAFVSYSNEDQDFVTNLVTKLENNRPFLKLCVYERDFQIGCAISESVLQSVVSSRKTILIISDAFAKSQWCRWEAKLAEYHHLFFENGDVKGTLLIILLGNVSESNMTPTLKYLLKTRIYLEWNPDPGKQEIFWTKLRKKLSHTNDNSGVTINET